MHTRILFILLFVSTLTFSQRPGGYGQGKTGEIFGTVIDSLTEKSLGYVTITAFKQPENKMIKGMVTSDNGNFSLAGLPMGTYKLKVSFVGYTTIFINDIQLTEEVSTYQFKKVTISPLILGAVEVVADQPIVTYEIDKKIINVENQLNTDGQTAVQVLENFPSISVDANGNVSLRGSSSFTLLIDGIPTNLNASDYLATMPASSIKEVEIITNPSARYDAEGTSGVINIITKKKKLQGMSSLINVSAGRFDNYNADASFNLKKKAFTFDLSADINQRNNPRNSFTERTTTYDSVTNVLLSNGESSWKMSGWGANGGITWKPNNSHVLSVKSNFRSTLMAPYSDLNYENYNNDTLTDAFFTSQNNNIDFVNSSTSLFYQYNIKRNKDHYISFAAVANLTYVIQNDTTLSFDENNVITAANLYTEVGPSNAYRFNLDYRLPLKNKMKFEAGLKSQFGQSGDIGKNYVYNTTTGEYDYNALFSSNVKYVRDVHAAYTMFGGKVKNLGYQLGVRAEYTYRTITSTSFVDFTTINRLDWFPSAHFSYSFKNKSQIILSYSRRISRPRSYYFEPFITWNSPYSVRTGNPNLLPEYIGAYELSFIKPIKKKGFFSIEAYYRNNINSIKRLNFVYEPGILISQPYNIGTSSSYGLETSFNYKFSKWWKTNIGLNNYLYNLSGSLNDVNYDVQSINWSVRATNTFDYKGYVLQFVSRVRSGSVTAQGESKSSYSQDLSIRKSFMKKKFSVTVQGRNVLGTARRESFSLTENVYIYNLSKPLYPQIMVTLSVKLNNYRKVYDRTERMDDF